MSDTIERSVLLDSPVERVWQAISDHREFGEWFRVALDQPFAAGQPSTGHITYPGYEHLRWNAAIEAVEPPRRLALRWHPFAIEPDHDYSAEPTTLVEFLLEPEANGTRLRVVESGFDRMPEGRRDEAYEANAGGWTEQMDNIKAHVGGA